MCWRCPTGSATQFEEITGWTDERLTMSGYGQGTYADFDPSASLIGESYEDFVARCRSEMFQAILRLKETVPVLFFTLNYLTAHPRGVRLMGWTQATLTYYEASAFMD